MARPVGSGRAWRTFEAAREFIRTLGLANSRAWVAYAKTPDRPEDIPYDPDRHYAEFAGWPDLLGDSYVVKDMKARFNYLSYDEVSAMARATGVTTKAQYDAWRKTVDSTRIPWSPSREYPEQWSSWSAFLQSGKPVRNRPEWMPFEEARQIARNSGVKSKGHWGRYVRETAAVNMPSSPEASYSEAWVSWPDWLGTAPGKAKETYRNHSQELLGFVREIFKTLPRLSDAIVCKMLRSAGLVGVSRRVFGCADMAEVIRR
jgi:hypothetical protein